MGFSKNCSSEEIVRLLTRSLDGGVQGVLEKEREREEDSKQGSVDLAFSLLFNCSRSPSTSMQCFSS